MSLTPAERQDRFQAAFLGLAIGDALGFPLRGVPPASLIRLPGLAEDFAPRPRGKFAKGQFSDDTQLMLAAAGAWFYLVANTFTLTCVRQPDQRPDCEVVRRLLVDDDALTGEVVFALGAVPVAGALGTLGTVAGRRTLADQRERARRTLRSFLDELEGV